MLADRPACHYSLCSMGQLLLTILGKTEQAHVSYWQTPALVWNDFAIAYFHIQYSLTFCKWQLVINWHHGSLRADVELEKTVFPWSKQHSEAAWWQAVSQQATFFKIHTIQYILGHCEKLGSNEHWSWIQMHLTLKIKMLLYMSKTESSVQKPFRPDCPSMQLSTVVVN